MAIPKRGSRKIVVDGETYRWYMRRKPSYGQGACESPMGLAVEHAEAGGSTLVVALPHLHPGNWLGETPVAVVPADVAEYIREALAMGWKPMQAGKPYLAQGERMAKVLEQAACLQHSSLPIDPIKWEREMRDERPLPGRDK